MSRRFKLLQRPLSGGKYSTAEVAVGLLLFAHLAVLCLWLWPPGGSRRVLTEERTNLRQQLASARSRHSRLEAVAAQVRAGSGQSAGFKEQFFLPRRQAYTAFVIELQRLASASSLRQRDTVFSEEAIEGSADLSLLSGTANFEGSYESLLLFLSLVDRSPMLLMLDNLQASPQTQKNGQINASIRIQEIVRDDGSDKFGTGAPASAARAETKKGGSI